MLNYIREEPAKFAAHIVSLIVATIAVLRSFGVGITDEQSAAVTELARGLVEIVVVQIAGSFVRAKVSPSKGGKGPGIGAVSLLLIVALALTGCGLFNRVSSFLGAQCDEYCDEAAVMFDLLCGRAEAKARGRSFDGVEQSRDFIDDVCRSEEAVQTYWPIVEQMIERGELRASRAAHARAEARRAERSE